MRNMTQTSSVLILFVLFSPLMGCGSGGDPGDTVEDLGVLGGKTDSLLSCRQVEVDPGRTRTFRVRSASVRVQVTQAEGSTVSGQLVIKSGTDEVQGLASTTPQVEARVEGTTMRTWTIRLTNQSTSEPLSGELCAWALEGAQPQDPNKVPTLSDPVQYENKYCTFADTIPYVRSVKWDDPTVMAAMRNIAPGYRSMFSYQEWTEAYGLESTKGSTLTPDEKRNRQARNWIRALCGEHRDYPAMIEAKLNLVATAHFNARPGPMTNVDTAKNLFGQITYEAYEKMVNTMRAVHSYRQGLLNQTAEEDAGYHYGYKDKEHWSNRISHSVPPWTHCEMKFMFEKYMTAEAPEYPEAEKYVTEYEAYKQTCTQEDFDWSYNFRGHRNFMPLWLECNAFVWNSRRARTAEINKGDKSYYLRPFASRYTRSRQAWATYLLYPEDDHQKMIAASDSGGGYITYVTDQDTDGDNLADYRLFDTLGCGDQGVAGSDPATNCNMVAWDVARAMANKTGHLGTWNPSWWNEPDFGFMKAATTFEDRMARFTQALDRHTNWGPTGYYIIEAAKADQPRYIGAYSPIVAASYDISASDGFAHRDGNATDPFESGQMKWMYIMRFRTENYYDEKALRDGKPMDFDKYYFNETSLSNDFYRERGMDRFGWVPNSDMYANIYFVYGSRGEEPVLVDIPPAP